MQFQTGRLILSPLDPTDAVALFAYRSNEFANRFQSWVPRTLEDVHSFIAKTPKEANLPDTWYQLGVRLKETGLLIGDLGIHFTGSENRVVELGCTLHSSYFKKGYATEALKVVIDFLFHKLNKHRITASIDPENEPSIRLVERLGFRKEAHFRESYFFKGQWVDDVIYALLRREWWFSDSST